MKRQKKKKKKVHYKLTPEKCINCGEKGAHFVGPSFGDKGFFICNKKRSKKTIIKEMKKLYPKKELAYGDYKDNEGSSIQGRLWDDFNSLRNQWNILIDELEGVK